MYSCHIAFGCTEGCIILSLEDRPKKLIVLDKINLPVVPGILAGFKENEKEPSGL